MLLVQVECAAMLTYQFHTRSDFSCRLSGGFHASAALTPVLRCLPGEYLDVLARVKWLFSRSDLLYP